MTQGSEGDLEPQRAAIDRSFQHGWVAAGSAAPRPDRARLHGSSQGPRPRWLDRLDHVTIQAPATARSRVRPSGSGTSAVSLIRALEPHSHAGRRLDCDQPTKKPITAALGGNIMLQAVRAAHRDDSVDLISCIELELPAEALCVGRLFGRCPLQPDDCFTMPDS
jgi:hypothetical protein